ncbi:MAG: VOC family protein [Parachlamydiaceae bacterium]
MRAEGFQLAWIVVKNLDRAVAFYRDTVGMELKEFHPEFRWAEMSGVNGAILGIGEEDPQTNIPAGSNAVVTITVADLDKALMHFKSRGAKLIDEVVEIPGHVKMQTFADADGNTLQLVQKFV